MTNDKDFKNLIRARVAKTGESYTTARQQLLREQTPPEPEHHETDEPPGSTTAFRLATAQSADRSRSAVDDVAAALYGDTGAEVMEGKLHVWMGQPRAFEISVPLEAIKKAERVPDRTPGGSLGVHGGRGRWLVNASYENLVALTLQPPQSAAVTMSSAMPASVRENTPWFVRALLRDRSPKVRVLTISVEDPDALLRLLSR